MGFVRNSLQQDLYNLYAVVETQVTISDSEASHIALQKSDFIPEIISKFGFDENASYEETHNYITENFELEIKHNTTGEWVKYSLDNDTGLLYQNSYMYI